MELRSWKCHEVELLSPSGELSGQVLPIIRGDEISQVSVVVVEPRTFIGWWIHADRDEWHTCIEGRVLIAQSGSGAIPTSQENPLTVHVPSLIIHGILNVDDTPAKIILTTSQPHEPDDQGMPMSVAPGELEHLINLWRDCYG